MKAQTQFLYFLFTCSHLHCTAQDYFSYGNSNFSGLNQVFANPAAVADNRLRVDVLLGGAEINFNNSWFAIKRSALNYTGSITSPSEIQLPSSWRNNTPHVPDNVYKNFTIVAEGATHNIIFESRVLLPSFLIQVNSRNTLAFTWSLRQILNIDGISPGMGNLFEQELNLGVLQNNRVRNENLSTMHLVWTEYGLTYARVLRDKNQHFFKAGVTPKIVQGLESTYFIMKELDFLFSNKDTNSYFSADFSYGKSPTASTAFRINNKSSGLYSNATAPSPALDLGIIYEWRPNYRKYKYKADGKNLSWRKDLNKYRLKFGAALTDIGRIKFMKEGSYYDLDFFIRQNDVNRYIACTNFRELDSLFRHDFPANKGPDNFSVYLPMALNTQADLALNRYFYLNLSSHYTGFRKSEFFKVHNYSALCLAPRLESYWVDLSLPLTYNTLSAERSRKLMYGLNARLGPLSFGSNDLIPLFQGDVAALNFYFILKVSIPYKLINDQDKDRLRDSRDECPDDYGPITLKGCPDKDKDEVADKDDACPGQPGVAALRGCPDSDSDGITDGEDLCPKEKGSLAMKGCPDTDRDSIPDKDDLCPDVAGPGHLKGCPDNDKDGVIDKEDLCPAAKGPAQNKGCPDSDNDKVHDGIDSCKNISGPAENRGCPWPDSDKDGIIDQLDSCISTPGVRAYKGCPEPLKLAPAQKRIVEKAISSLEFESGKDIIKPVSYSSLNALAKLMVSHKTEWKIKLSGHTDNEGTEAANMILSEKRTKALQKYLVKKGLPPENIVTEWFGQSKPVADNATKEGRKKNRRVEMKLMTME